jgi:IS5 family transposase
LPAYLETDPNTPDGKLGRNWLKEALGDAINAVLCGAGHNLRLIINKLKATCSPSYVH